MTVNEYTFLSSNGKNQIRVKKWIPDVNPVGVIQFAHGLCGYIELHEDTARWFCERGYIFIANDALGHGPLARDSGDLGYFADSDGWQHVVNDFATVFDCHRREHPHLPCWLIGNSMGSFILRTFLIQRQDKISGAVLVGTSMNSREVLDGGRKIVYENLERKGGLRGHTGKLLYFMFNHYNDRFQPARTDTDWVNRDPEMVDRTAADPLANFFFSMGLQLDMSDGQEFNMQPENITKMEKSNPVLIISGGDDAAGNFGEGPALVHKAFLDAGMLDVQLKLYPGARHDLLHELNSQQVLQELLEWMQAHI